MKIRVGVVQDHPVFLDKSSTLSKVADIVAKHAEYNLIVFPESFIPGYPRGFSFGATVGSRSDAGRQLYKDYHRESIDLKSPDLEYLEQVAAANGVYLVIGVTEKNRLTGSLFCSMLYISPKCGLMAVHRKIKPTGSERIIWSEAAGDSLVAVQTKIGRIGGLICWENYMPLARMSMYRQGVEIYIAPTADARKTWTATMKHIAMEGRCFVLGSNQFFTRAMYPSEYRGLLQKGPEIICRGGSVIVSPMGELLAGPLFDRAGILTAVIDLDDIVRSKLDFDVVGHYARDDIFQLSVLNQPGLILEEE